jgi:hypothetical protein
LSQLQGGATLPYSAVALGVSGSLVAAGVGLGGAYIGGVAANQKFNPIEWNWKSPQTYGGLFNGFTAGFGIVKGVVGISESLGRSSIALIASNSKTFTALAVTGAVGYGYYEAVQVNDGNAWFWEWNWSEENMSQTVGAMFGGISMGISAMNILAGRHAKKIERSGNNPNSISSNLRVLVLQEQLTELFEQLPPEVTATIQAVVTTFFGEAASLAEIDFANFDFEKISNGVEFLEQVFVARRKYKDAMELHKAVVKTRKQIDQEKEAEVPLETEEYQDYDDVPAENDEPPETPREVRSLPQEYLGIQGFPEIVNNESINKTSTFNMLELGDKWLQETDTLGNLTLLSLVVDKFFKSKKAKSQTLKKNGKSIIEIQLLASEVVNEFVEKLLDHFEDNGVSSFQANLILEEAIGLQTITRNVEKGIRSMNIETVLSVLRREVVAKSLKVLKREANHDELQKNLEKEVEAIRLKLLKSMNKM